jgi:DNA (cytosine-5)-methyltransferase 1
MENVRGLLSAAIKHRPLHLREDEDCPIEPDEKLGSVLNQVILIHVRCFNPKYYSVHISHGKYQSVRPTVMELVLGNEGGPG